MVTFGLSGQSISDLSFPSGGNIQLNKETNNLWPLYQKAEVVDPDPCVALMDAACPGRLVYLLHCSNSNVRHRSVGQRKGDADPLSKGQKQGE